MSRIAQLLRQLQALRTAQPHFFTDFAWTREYRDEPLLLVDTGAKDGLCGDKWAIHAARWAADRGHKWKTSKLSERRTVSGVGAGAQSTEDAISIPIGLEDKSGNNYLADYNAAVIRDSSLPALLGLDSLSKQNAIINCKSGEIWFTDKQGCDIKPRGTHVHMQMVKSRHGDHWYLPIGRFKDGMTKLEEVATSGHLAATSKPSASSNSSSSTAGCCQ